jgi:hypothetical protein
MILVHTMAIIDSHYDSIIVLCPLNHWSVFLSKQDVLLYINEAKVSVCDTNGQCDTSSEDNVCLFLTLLPPKEQITSFECLIFPYLYHSFGISIDTCKSGLLAKWVAWRLGRELVYIEKQRSWVMIFHHWIKDHCLVLESLFVLSCSITQILLVTFRTLKFALSFLETGKVSKWAFTQRTSVHDLYSFDMSTDLVIVLLNLCLSNKNLHDMLFPSYLDFEHHQAEFKDSEFVLCELIQHSFIANFQIVLYLFSLSITWPPFLLPLPSVV